MLGSRGCRCVCVCVHISGEKLKFHVKYTQQSRQVNVHQGESSVSSLAGVPFTTAIRLLQMRISNFHATKK